MTWSGAQTLSEGEGTRPVPADEAGILISEFQKMKTTLPKNCNRIHIWLHAEIFVLICQSENSGNLCKEKQIKPLCFRRL